MKERLPKQLTEKIVREIAREEINKRAIEKVRLICKINSAAAKITNQSNETQ
jgi:hypothetical protein